MGGTEVFTAAMSDDPELMRRLQTGDEGAYTALYQRWKGPVYRFLVRRTGAISEAEEALQETWLRVYRSAGRFDPDREFRHWLFAIAANAGRDARRRERAIFHLEPQVTEPNDIGDRVLGALAELAPDDRKVLLLAVEGFNAKEIAEMLGLGHGAVRMRLSRARERARELVKE